MKEKNRKKVFYRAMAASLAVVMMLGGCGKSNKNGEKNPDFTPTVTVTEEVKSPKEQALSAYKVMLAKAPGVAGAEEILADLTFGYDDNMAMFGEHIDRYAFYDIDLDGIPELITMSVVNNRWTPISIYTYADGKVVLLKSPLEPGAHGTFEQISMSNGSYILFFCEENHIHNLWRGEDPFGNPAEENYAYVMKGTDLETVDCALTDMTDRVKPVYFSDISEKNTVSKVWDVPEPTPIPTVEIVRKTVKVDYYKLPEIYSKFLTEEEIAFYNKFVTAWLNYEPKVQFDNKKQIEHVWGMIQECFFLAYGDFDEAKGFTVDDRYVYFPYISQSKEEHDRIIAEFEGRLQTYFEDIPYNEEGYELARHIYINYNKTIAYDYDVSENDNFTFGNSSGYTAIMKGTGVCSSFAKGYTFLARMAGLEAFDVSGIGYPEPHEWAALKIGDKYYFADPTWDYVTPTPELYRYFCFGLDQRESDGFAEELMSLCCCGDFKMSDYVTIERNGYEQ